MIDALIGAAITLGGYLLDSKSKRKKAEQQMREKFAEIELSFRELRIEVLESQTTAANHAYDTSVAMQDLREGIDSLSKFVAKELEEKVEPLRQKVAELQHVERRGKMNGNGGEHGPL